jgi:hypothetical protein
LPTEAKIILSLFLLVALFALYEEKKLRTIFWILITIISIASVLATAYITLAVAFIGS